MASEDWFPTEKILDERRGGQQGGYRVGLSQHPPASYLTPPETDHALKLAVKGTTADSICSVDPVTKEEVTLDLTKLHNNRAPDICNITTLQRDVTVIFPGQKCLRRFRGS